MNSTNWLGICNWLTIVCGVLLVLATYGVRHFSSRIQEEKDKKIDLLLKDTRELNKKIELYQTELTAKDKEISELQANVKKAERGITSIYDFNGTKRSTSRPGHISVNAGTELKVFRRMIELEKTKDFAALAKICEKQIAETPEWLTPYFYLGIATANLGDNIRAIDLFEYVRENAAGDPAYEQANDFLRQLKHKTS